jgi:hypothetical protein
LLVLFALDPDRSLGSIAAEADLDIAALIPTVRSLYELGFLERA